MNPFVGLILRFLTLNSGDQLAYFGQSVDHQEQQRQIVEGVYDQHVADHLSPPFPEENRGIGSRSAQHQDGVQRFLYRITPR